MKPRSDQAAPVRLARVLAAALLMLAVVGCTGDEGSPEDGVLLTASEVQGTEAKSGTDLLTPAVEGCDTVDGDYLWQNATDDDVRSFTRDVDGGTQTTVIGAWPMPEDEALEALRQQLHYPGECVPDDTSVQARVLGGVDDAYSYEGRTWEIEYHNEDSPPESHAMRAYRYTQGHMVIVWVDQPGSTPDTDRVVELLNKQAQKINDNT